MKSPIHYSKFHVHWLRCMMTSSNGNIFRVTGHLCGEFTGHRWIPRTKACAAELRCFLWSVPWINGWVNNGEAGDLRRHRSHYDVTATDCTASHLNSLRPSDSYMRDRPDPRPTKDKSHNIIQISLYQSHDIGFPSHKANIIPFCVN